MLPHCPPHIILRLDRARRYLKCAWIATSQIPIPQTAGEGKPYVRCSVGR